MNVEEGRGDTGVSRYPPAGGERYPQRGPAMNVGEGRGDTGVSSFPPAEGERNVPAEAPRPPSGAEPTEDNGAVGPPGPTAAASTRAGANAPKGKGGADRQRDHLQATTVSREKAVFPFPSFNSTGLLPIEPLVASMTGTLCLAAALRESEKDDDQDIFDSDTLGSDGPGRTSGGEGIADSEIKRVGAAETRPLLARLGLDPRQTFGSGGESGDISQRQGDTGLSRYPPAAGERSFPSAGAPAEAKGLFGKNEAAWYSAHAQATVVTQVHNVFPAPYTGPKSLKPSEPAANTMTGTVFYAARLCESERNDTQIIFNPETAGGGGFSGSAGIAGFPNGEATRVGVPNPTPYIARLYVRQTFGFGGEREWAPDDENQVAGERDVRRLAVIVGKLAAPDIADDNRYAHDPRTQFLNWALVYNGAWDYPANVRGYNYGVALDYNHSKNLSFSYGVFMEPATANGVPSIGTS